jgi:hypothetical protein
MLAARREPERFGSAGAQSIHPRRQPLGLHELAGAPLLVDSNRSRVFGILTVEGGYGFGKAVHELESMNSTHLLRQARYHC